MMSHSFFVICIINYTKGLSQSLNDASVLFTTAVEGINFGSFFNNFFLASRKNKCYSAMLHL